MNQVSFEKLPHVVITGTVGVGKSTVVSNIVKKANPIGSSSSSSATKISKAYISKYFVIIDTPGCNPRSDKLQHNYWIAQAFCHRPISLMLICVEAHVRMDQTLYDLIDFYERFGNFDSILCPMITKMDQVNWSENEMRRALMDDHGITRALFNRIDKSTEALQLEIISMCSPKPFKIDINHENFLRYFKIEDNNIKILRITRELVNTYEGAVTHIQEILKRLKEDSKMDLVFQFQQFMLINIPKMQSKLSDLCEFTFLGSNAEVEYGHIANLGRQLKKILYNIRIMALGYASTHGVSNLRKCPYCNLVWSKVSGCDGETTCGNIPSDVIESKLMEFSTFSFSLFPFSVETTGKKNLNHIKMNNKGVGCGNKITWSQMQPVPVPDGITLSDADITTDDVNELPKGLISSYQKIFISHQPKIEYS